MKKMLFLSIACLLIAFGSASASFTLDSVEGAWSNPVGGVAITYPVDIPTGYGNGLEDQIRWSTAAAKSGLGFTGNSGSTFEAGDILELGRLRHYNYVIPSSSEAPTAADLTVSMVFSDPLGFNPSYVYTLGINETPNGQAPGGVDDIITIGPGEKVQNFVSGDTVYTLTLLGFGNSEAAIAESFVSPEDSINRTLLWGTLTTRPVNTIPAPGAILLGGLGTLLVGWFRKRFV